jgi:hypothetical protein
VKLLLPVRGREDRGAVGCVWGCGSPGGLGVDTAGGVVAGYGVLVLVVCVGVLVGVLVMLQLVLVLGRVLDLVLVGMRVVAIRVLHKISRRLRSLRARRGVLCCAGSENGMWSARPGRGGVVGQRVRPRGGRRRARVVHRSVALRRPP